MWIENKYIMMISSSLLKFTEKDDGKFNFRCVYCGDSEKNQNIARGYLLPRTDGYYSYCHNCHESHSFGDFLKHVNPTLYDEYIQEKFLDGNKRKKSTKSEKKILHKEQDNLGIPSIMWLELDHPARAELDRRKIPSRWHSRLYYAENFNAFANKFVPNKYNPEKGEPRIVIPLRSRSGKLSGFQGRSLEEKPRIKYLTVLLAPDNNKLFNMDRVNLNITNYALEGAFDAMILNNAFAVCGSDLNSAVKKAELNTANTAFVFDNEPRNKDIVKQMNKTIVNGHKIVIWPDSVPVGYDINDAHMNGHDIEKILLDNTYRGMEAELQFSIWKK